VPACAHLLQDVMARLQHLLASSPSPLVSKCLQDLQDCIHLQHVVFFSSSEDQIGSIKYFLTHYIRMVLRKNRGLLLKTSSNNSICAPVTSTSKKYGGSLPRINGDSAFFSPSTWKFSSVMVLVSSFWDSGAKIFASSG
jgi:hypothetical protein